MNLIELTTFDWVEKTENTISHFKEVKTVFNFNHVVSFKKMEHEGSLARTEILFKNEVHYTKETPEQIEKLLNETGHFIKRVYKPEQVFISESSGVKVELS